MALLTTDEQVNILIQEVSRLHKENIEIREQMIEVVKSVQKTFLMMNDELTRIAKLP